MSTPPQNDLINGHAGQPKSSSVRLSPSAITCRGEQDVGHLELLVVNRLG